MRAGGDRLAKKEADRAGLRDEGPGVRIKINS
jgi:hypothetical protein